MFPSQVSQKKIHIELLIQTSKNIQIQSSAEKLDIKEIKKPEKAPIVKKDKKLISEVKKVELKKQSNNKVTKKKVKKVIYIYS